MFGRKKIQTPPMPQVSGTVLIVDDDPRQRTELSDCLVRTGVHVIECARGDIVLDALREYPADLVILDVNLPGRRGDELVDDIHAQSPDTKILLMTGNPDNVVAINEAHLAVFATLEKPVPLRSLVRFVTSALSAAHVVHRGPEVSAARPLYS